MKRSYKFLLSTWIIIIILTLLYPLVRGNSVLANNIIKYFSAPIRETMGLVCNVFPFSVAELLYTVIAVVAVAFIIGMVKAVRKSSHKIKELCLRLTAVALIPAVLITGYNWLWALGYYAETFTEKSGLANDGVAVEDLKEVTILFAEKATELSTKVKRDEAGHFIEKDFWKDTEGLYDSMEAEFPFLKNYELRPKPMIYSYLMSVIGFTGFYFPFTGEANVNAHFPAALQPVTIAHELAHQRRVAAEEEANFVGIAACLSSDKTVYQYSGALSGLTHLSNALYEADKDAWAEISANLSDEVLIDWRDSNEYWDKFESPVEEVATGVYDTYLKANDQELGIKSYGACVDLLVEYYRIK